MIKSLFVFYTNKINALLPGAPLRRVRIALWRMMGFDIDKGANIYPDVVLLWAGPESQVVIGDGTYVGSGTWILGGSVLIGKNCDIAPRNTIHAGSHEQGTASRRAGRTYAGKIVIGDGVWIGTNSTILEGATIGDGCIVAAGSVVKAGEYPPNVLLAGVPAVIKKTLP